MTIVTAQRKLRNLQARRNSNMGFKSHTLKERVRNILDHWPLVYPSQAALIEKFCSEMERNLEKFI